MYLCLPHKYIKNPQKTKQGQEVQSPEDLLAGSAAAAV